MANQEKRTALVYRALRRILRPLVRLMVAHQITYNDFSKMVKEIFVSVADQDFKLDDKEQTDSRLSLLTGIHRKEVKKLRYLPEQSQTAAASSVTAQLITAWLSDPHCIDESGHPVPLPPNGELNTATGVGTFEYLVNHISKGNLRVATVLNECIRLGIVELNDEGFVCVKVDAFVPTQDFADKMYFFENNLASHIEASCHNMRGSNQPYFERSLSYNYISNEAIELFKQMLEDDGMALLKKANRKAKLEQHKQRDASSGSIKENNRMLIGLYYYHEPMVEREQQADEK